MAPAARPHPSSDIYGAVLMSGYTLVGLIGFLTCIAVAFLLGVQFG